MTLNIDEKMVTVVTLYT